MGEDMGALSGSREPSPDGLGPSGFDPARIAGLGLSASPNDLIRRGDILEHLRDAMMASVALTPEIRTILQTYIRDALKAAWRALAVKARGRTEGESNAAWTATDGYKRYPPYVNLTGNRLTIREVETVNADPYGHDVFQGRTVFIDLPDEALRGLASAIEARRAETVKLGSVHESVVGNAETPNLNHHHGPTPNEH